MNPHDTQQWRDLDAVLVVKKLDECWMDFEVIGVTSWEHWIDSKHVEVATFHKRGYRSSDDETTDPDEADRIVSGYVKWDGCAQFDFAPDNGGGTHLCGAGDALRLSRIIKRVYEYTAAHMAHFDRAVAGFPGST